MVECVSSIHSNLQIVSSACHYGRPDFPALWSVEYCSVRAKKMRFLVVFFLER